MKRILALLAACGLGGLSLAATQLSSQAPSEASPGGPAPAEKFVVHEWGTFTGLAGSDGVHLPFGTTVGGDLPSFVVTRQEQAVRQGTELSINYLLLKGGGVIALQRMETPVIYFYSDRPRDVSVAVDFPQGLLTEFYPPVRGMSPAFGEGPGEFGAVKKQGTPDTFDAPATRPTAARLERGSLDWGQVRILPLGPEAASAQIPEVPADHRSARHYQYARETDAAVVRYSDRPGETHDERFLFYRGLGDFSLPITLTAEAGGTFILNNSGPQPIRFALMLRTAGGTAQFAVYRDVAARQAMELPAEKVALSQVGDAITQALIAEGLYEKEAKAMVKTWSSNWLGEEGTRLLYTVPREVTDSLLPLRISPAPDETVRVLVGRIDILTPEQEAQIGAMLAASLDKQTKWLSPEDAALLRSLGRFREPAIERVSKLRGNKKASEEIKALWGQLRASPMPGEASLR